MMKFHFLLLLFLLPILNLSAQVDLKKTTSLMQECLNLNANTKGSHLALYEHNGVLAYQFSGVVQKIKLEDLDQVQVNKNDAGFSVDIKCANENGCITFQKNDTSSQQFQTTAIQFIDARLANTFVQNMASLINHYKPAENNISQQLFKNEKGETPILMPKQTPTAKQSPAKKVEQNDDEDEDEDTQVKEEKTTKKVSNRKKENDEEKTKTREVKRKNNKANNQADDEDTDDDVRASRTEKSKRNHLIEDSDDIENDTKKDAKKNDFCSQLMAIIQSGKETKFSSIEGKATTEDSKINESQIKLKGAKKNYLSWYKKERAFIAELKTGRDYDAVYKEFEAIQTTLDDCLGGTWSTDDLSTIDEYSNFKKEVKDIQFENESDKSSPKIRVIFIEGDKTFSLFLRIQ